MSMKKFAALFAVLLLTGCSTVGDMFADEDPPLEGERISVLELQKSLEPDDSVLEEQGFVAPAPWRNEFWPQAGGYPNHSMQNVALGGAQKKLWSTDIGQGSTDELPLTAQPVIVDGRIYALDTDSHLSAFEARSGKQVWSINVQDPDEDDPVISGGIAYANGILYVTNGYDEVLAVNPANGEIIWRKNIPTPSRAAPTIMNDRLFLSTLDNRLIAMDARDGSILWDYQGISETAGLVGAASPAANQDIVVAAFSSGELTALRVENGSVAWSDNLSNLRAFGGLAALADIKALPVIDKGLVIGMSFSNRLVAIDERTGTRIWQREIGGSNTPWVAGNHLFVLSSDNQLIGLGRDTGAIRWVTHLPTKNDDEPIIFSGPVMAGDRLLIFSSEGVAVELSPETGKITSERDIGMNVMIPPVVAGGVLYLLGEDGTLAAYQ